MFSDDIWNLVYCHKAENSSKSNKMVPESIIEKLERRNEFLLQRMDELEWDKDKKYDELKLACENDYVRKFWIAMRG